MIITFSSNLFSATYLVCDNYKNEINLKISFKNIFVKTSNEDEYVSYKKSIEVWNKEIIKFSKEKSHWYPTMKYKSDYTVLERKACEQCREEYPDQSNPQTGYIDMECTDVCELFDYKKTMRKINIIIDRVTGRMNWGGDEYQCEVKKKTLF
tara:strand:+ start:391 stop:846 length:456 start_codon:yes stop_codon:yes gene_type:complete